MRVYGEHINGIGKSDTYRSQQGPAVSPGIRALSRPCKKSLSKDYQPLMGRKTI